MVLLRFTLWEIRDRHKLFNLILHNSLLLLVLIFKLCIRKTIS